MNSFLFCVILDVSLLIMIGWLGLLVFRGATPWLIVIMGLLVMPFTIPSTSIFTCPKCGWIGKVETYKANPDITAVREDKGEEIELQKENK